MDAIVKQFQRNDAGTRRPSQKEAEEAVRTLLRYIGDDPDREGLKDTPRRVVKSYAEIYGGYEQDPEDVLGRTFEEVAGYDDITPQHLEKISSYVAGASDGGAKVAFGGGALDLGMGQFMAPTILSGVTRDMAVAREEVFGPVLSILTFETVEEAIQIANAIDEILQPKGVAVLIEADHMCMAMRGVQKIGSSTMTTTFTGTFKHDPREQARFMSMLRGF